MADESEYEVIEEIVVQIDDDFHDTAPMAIPPGLAGARAQTHADWPPAPPPPADLDLAVGTITEGVPPRRHAGIFAAQPRPTTASDDTDD
ncbi:MAG TPA: hypothetical protein VIV11_38160 [Kofleriaceae bacterium]